MGRQERDVFLALAERHDLDGKNIQAVIKVFPEAAGGDFLFQIAIGGGDDAHIGKARAVFPDAFVAFFLQGPEQLALQIEGDFTDFIQKQGSALGGFKAAGAILDCAGESAFGVAEKFTLV